MTIREEGYYIVFRTPSGFYLAALTTHPSGQSGSLNSFIFIARSFISLSTLLTTWQSFLSFTKQVTHCLTT